MRYFGARMLAAIALFLLSADAGVEAAAPKALFVLATSQEAVDKWAAAKPAERAAVKGIVDKVKINERVWAAIVLDGYTLPRSRKVELNADLIIVDSTGRTVVEKVSAATARTFDPKTQTAVVLKPVGGLIYGVTDPEGLYTARVTIWDQIRGEAAKSETQFTVTR